MRDILKDLAHVVLEAKKYHNLSSAAGETVMLMVKFRSLDNLEVTSVVQV